MYLGTEKKPFSEVAYTWFVSISLNVLLYISIGLVAYYVRSPLKNAEFIESRLQRKIWGHVQNGEYSR